MADKRIEIKSNFIFPLKNINEKIDRASAIGCTSDGKMLMPMYGIIIKNNGALDRLRFTFEAPEDPAKLLAWNNLGTFGGLPT